MEPLRRPAADETGLQIWTVERAGDVAALAREAMPAEQLDTDDLARCLWDVSSPCLVAALPDASGVVAGVVRDTGFGKVAGVQLVAVRPAEQGRGRGRALLRALSTWAFEEHGAVALTAGGLAPYYLWAGVDVRATAALCLFDRLGFQRTGATLNMSFPSHHRSPVPTGVHVRRTSERGDAQPVLEFVGQHWAMWVAEVERAISRGSCFALIAHDGGVVGFGCHSVNRRGWLGPMGTDPARRQAGLGNALLGAIAADVAALGLSAVEVSWVGPLGFYAKAAGATMSRAFLSMNLPRPPS